MPPRHDRSFTSLLYVFAEAERSAIPEVTPSYTILGQALHALKKQSILWDLQVYKAKVRKTGQVVAVKVQRPNVRESIALDVFIMRYLVGRFGILRKLNSDLPSLLDEWAGSLFRELDYRREARNGTKFQELYSHLEV